MEEQEMLQHSLMGSMWQSRAKWTYLEIETVEEFRNEGERREEDLQDVNICGVSLTQLNGSLRQRWITLMKH